MQNEGYTLQDVTGFIRRRAGLIGTTFLTIALLSVVIPYSLEDLYESSGTIIIERPEVSEKFLPGTYQDVNRQQRISRINDEVMTKENLVQMVKEHDLYPEIRDGGLPETVINELLDNFELELFFAEDDPRNKYVGEVTGFRLSYYHPDPVTARDVARDIVNLFQEGNLQRRQQAYNETAAALKREADNLKEQVQQAERMLAAFKTRHPGALPEDRNFNRQIIERKARDLDGLDREIRSLQERKTLLQSQLAQTNPWLSTVGPDGEVLPASTDRLQDLQSEYLRMLGNYNANHPDVLRLRREIESLTGGAANPALRQAAEMELDAKRAQLVEARLQYGEDHPDIRNLERAIIALEQQIAAMPIETADAPPPNNPIYINLQLQLDGVNTELGALREDRQLLRAEIGELDKNVQVAPEVEREYLEITRDLGLARKQYEDIKTRQMTVERAGYLEEEELSERYVVTAFPSLSYTPAYPNRPLIITVSLFLGLTFGVGLGIVVEALDGTVRSTRDIQTILEMPPIAAIPVIATTADQRHSRNVRLMTIAGAVAMIVVVTTYVHLQRTGAI